MNGEEERERQRSTDIKEERQNNRGRDAEIETEKLS